MLPNAFISHQIEGRVRIRIPSKRRDQAYFDAIKQTLCGQEGIRALHANPLTASVLIIHGLNVETIAEYAEQNGLFTLVPVETAIIPFSQGVSDQFHTLDERLRAKTWGVLDFSGLAFLGLVVAGAAQLAKKNVWPAAATLLWYAVSVLPAAKGKHLPPGP